MWGVMKVFAIDCGWATVAGQSTHRSHCHWTPMPIMEVLKYKNSNTQIHKYELVGHRTTPTSVTLDTTPIMEVVLHHQIQSQWLQSLQIVAMIFCCNINYDKQYKHWSEWSSGPNLLSMVVDKSPKIKLMLMENPCVCVA